MDSCNGLQLAILGIRPFSFPNHTPSAPDISAAMVSAGRLFVGEMPLWDGRLPWLTGRKTGGNAGYTSHNNMEATSI